MKNWSLKQSRKENVFKTQGSSHRNSGVSVQNSAQMALDEIGSLSTGQCLPTGMCLTFSSWISNTTCLCTPSTQVTTTVNPSNGFMSTVWLLQVGSVSASTSCPQQCSAFSGQHTLIWAEMSLPQDSLS